MECPICHSTNLKHTPGPGGPFTASRFGKLLRRMGERLLERFLRVKKREYECLSCGTKFMV